MPEDKDQPHFKNMKEYMEYMEGTSPYGRSEGTQMRDKHGRPMFDKWGRPMIVPGTPRPGDDVEEDDNKGDDDSGGGKKKGRWRW